MNAAAANIQPALSERDVRSFVIDSREVGAGDVFFALSQPDYSNNGFNGDFDDATKYVASSFANGASACVVRPDRFEEHRSTLEPFRSSLIFVDDTIASLQALAAGVYREWNGPVIAITGSAGKTTAKELTALGMEAGGRKVLRNIKNYNNGLGHPLTVLELAKDTGYDIAVLEMGMSTPMNEIRRLCAITPPDVAVVLNVLPVHVEHLGSIENVAKAKAEIVEGMKPGGTAVLNADDPRVAAMADQARARQARILTFGIDNAADLMAEDIRSSALGTVEFTLRTPAGTSPVKFRLSGRHNILNALAAAAAGHAMGVDTADIATQLEKAGSPPQRGEILRFAEGFTVVNDSYNSNPDALLSMVRTVMENGPADARRIVVAGEMLELGLDGAAIHHETGRQIAAAGVTKLIGVRGLARDLVAGASEAGLSNAVFVADTEAAGELVAGDLRPGDIVLVKGSRGVRTEKVVELLLSRFSLVAG